MIVDHYSRAVPSKCGPRTSSLSTTEELVSIRVSWAPPRPTESGSISGGWGPGGCLHQRSRPHALPSTLTALSRMFLRLYCIMVIYYLSGSPTICGPWREGLGLPIFVSPASHAESAHWGVMNVSLWLESRALVDSWLLALSYTVLKKQAGLSSPVPALEFYSSPPRLLLGTAISGPNCDIRKA